MTNESIKWISEYFCFYCDSSRVRTRFTGVTQILDLETHVEFLIYLNIFLYHVWGNFLTSRVH